MKTINTYLTMSAVRYTLIALVAVVVAIFAVSPLLPDLNPSTNEVSLQASILSAFAGDAGGDGTGGGDAGPGCCGDGGDSGSVSDTGTSPEGPSAPAATCSLSIDKSSVTVGEQVTLSWSTSNGYTATLNQTTVALNGSKSDGPTQNATYTLVVYSDGGNATCSKSVTVKPAPVAPTCSLTASAANITSGQTVTLSWSSSYGNTATLNGSTVALNGSKSDGQTQNATYSLVVYGDGGQVTCSKSVSVNPAPKPAPTCTLNSNMSTVIGGQGIVLSWSSNHGNTATLNGSGVALNGSGTYYPSSSGNYTFVVNGDGGSLTCTKYITVNPAPKPAPTCSLTSNRDTITSGEGVTLTWNSTNGTSATIAGGATSLAGSYTYYPTTHTTYTFRVVGEGGEKSCTKYITVNPAPKPAPTCTLSADKNTITVGDSVRLTWSSTNGNSATLNGAWAALNGNNTYYPTASGNYTFRVVGEGGEKTCTQYVTVHPKPEPSAPTCTLTASPDVLTTGNSTVLSWTTTNASSISLNQGIGSVAANGSKTVWPTSSKEYIVTATGPGGYVNCQKFVTVNPAPKPAPTCSLSADRNTITSGEGVTLTWNSTNGTSATIAGGATSLAGSYTYYPTTHTTYTFRVVGEGGEKTCTQYVTVHPKPAPSAPTCSLTANKSVITRGEGVTLTWSSSNGTTATLGGSASSLSGSGTYYPTMDTTYSYVVSGTGGQVTCTKYVTVNVPTTPSNPAPTCSLTASTNSITKGESLTLSWSSSNGSAATLNGVGVAQNGSGTYAPTSNTTYTFVVSGNGGQKTCSESVTVTTPTQSEPVAPSCPLTAKSGRTIVDFTNRTKLVSGGTRETEHKSVSLTRGTYAVTLVSWDGYNGRESVSQPHERWNMVLANSGGVITRSAASGDITDYVRESVRTDVVDTSLVVGSTVTSVYGEHAFYNDTSSPNSVVPICVAFDKESDPDPTPVLSCDSFTASPNNFTGNGTATLTWRTSNASQVSINQGVGTVAGDGSRTVSVTGDITYTLTATRGSETVTCTAPINFEPAPKAPKCDAFTVNPSTISGTTDVTLSWNTTDATSVSISDGVGSVAVDGSTKVTLSGSETFTLTATNAHGSDTCEVSVNYEKTTTSSSGGGSSSAPRCSLEASDTRITTGEKVTLSWDNLRTNDILLEDSRGNILVDTDEDSSYDEDEDSIVVKPTKTTTYTLTAIRGTKERDCSVKVTVEDEPVTISTVRTQAPLVAGISLTSVPYTGFEAGPILTTLFYVLLGLWALGIAYVLVVRRGRVAVAEGAPTVASSEVPHYTAEETTHDVLIPVSKEQTVAVETPNLDISLDDVMVSSAVVPSNLPTGIPPSVVGYAALSQQESEQESEIDEEVVTEDVFSVLENRAHKANVLLSSDALRFITGQSTELSEQIETLDYIIAQAKASFPSEDGWVIVNKERIAKLLS